MSYDRINPDGSITRMPGTYNVRKNKAIIQKTIDTNNKIRQERKKKSDEELVGKSERISSYLNQLAEGKSARLEDYVG